MSEEINTKYLPQQVLNDRLNDELFNKRNIFIFDDIDWEMAAIVVKQLLCLSKTKEPINIFIYSTGGDPEAASTIIDTMLLIQNHNIIKIIAFKALSAAAYIVAMGTKEYRYALSNSIFLMHKTTFELTMDREDNQSACIEFSKKQNEALYKQIAKACGKTKETFCKDIIQDLYMNAQEAKKYKLIDKIIKDISEI